MIDVNPSDFSILYLIFLIKHIYTPTYMATPGSFTKAFREFPEPVQLAAALLEFARFNTELYIRAYNRTHDIPTLYSISTHITLFSAIEASTSTKFTDINDAIDNSLTVSDSFVVSFPAVGLYAVFQPDKYIEFLDIFRGGGKNIKDTVGELYQIVLCNSPQKMVFVSDNAENYNILREIAESTFDAPTSIDDKQITVHIIADSDKNLHSMHDKFITAIQAKMGPKLSKSVHFPRMEDNGKHTTYSYSIMNSLNDRVTNLEELYKAIMTRAGPTTITYNFGNNCAVNINSSNSNATATTPIENVAAEYIESTPPKETETKRQYYKNFLSSNDLTEKDFSIRSFGSKVKNAGYTRGRVGKDYGWKKGSGESPCEESADAVFPATIMPNRKSDIESSLSTSSQFIYVISDKNQSGYKVGRTTKSQFYLESRYLTHNIAIKVEYYQPCKDNYKAESEILYHFDKFRVINIHNTKSEWIDRPLNEILSTVKTIMVKYM